MSRPTRQLETNRRLWDGWTEIHRRSSFYDVDPFRGGASTLKSIEVELVGDVRGKELLHLQCHFGLDTLSWARLGARVTGVDSSPRAIALARDLAGEAGLDGELREYPHSPYGCFEYLEEVAPDRWKVRGVAVDLPLVFAIRATKPEEGP